MDYFINLQEQMITSNKKAYHEAIMDAQSTTCHGKAKAWDNKKAKTYKSTTPRGRTYKRQVQLDRTSWFSRTKYLIDKIKLDTLVIRTKGKN